MTAQLEFFIQLIQGMSTAHRPSLSQSQALVLNFAQQVPRPYGDRSISNQRQPITNSETHDKISYHDHGSRRSSYSTPEEAKKYDYM